MDRHIVYPGSIPLDTDLLSVQRSTMVALGALAQAVLGSSPVADGLVCVPTVPASLQVVVGPGSLTALSVLDAQPFGSLPALGAVPLVKTGINTENTVFTLQAPSGSGQAITYLVQASLAETDAAPVVLPYYNAADPAQPFSGPGNSGVAQNTRRLQRVQLQCKPGAAAPAGTQTPPVVDAGWVGLYLITVNHAQSAITAANIAVLPTAPFVPFKLPRLAPGFSRQTVITSSTGWHVPAGVYQVRMRLVGGGGGGGGGTDKFSGGGGGAGGFAEGGFAVTPGQRLDIVVGAGGGGSAPGQVAANGGTTSVGGMLSATGGAGGESATPYSPGGRGGVGSGGSLVQAGGFGVDGFPNTVAIGGAGGASFFGGGGRGSYGGGMPANGQAHGSGGGGGYGQPCAGGTGAPGLVVIEY